MLDDCEDFHNIASFRLGKQSMQEFDGFLLCLFLCCRLWNKYRSHGPIVPVKLVMAVGGKITIVAVKILDGADDTDGVDVSRVTTTKSCLPGASCGVLNVLIAPVTLPMMTPLGLTHGAVAQAKSS